MDSTLTSAITTIIILVPAYAVAGYFRKKGWLQNKKIIFVGKQQLVFACVSLAVATFSAMIFFAKTRNIFSFSSVALIIFALVLILLRWVVAATIPLVLSMVTTWVGEVGLTASLHLSWYTSLAFILPLIATLFLISIKDDEMLLKKPWNKVESILRKQGASVAEIDKFKEYWQQKSKSSLP